QIASLLKFNRQVEGCRNVDAANLTTFLRSAFIDLILPIGEATGIRSAIEKIKIVLTDEEVSVEAGVLDRVRPIHCFVAVDGYGEGRLRTERTTDRIRKVNSKRLRTFTVAIVNDEDWNGFGVFTGSEWQSAQRSEKVRTLAARAIHSRVVDRSGVRGAAVSGNPNLNF